MIFPSFPKSQYNEETEYLAYSGMVTAQYTFYNPANYTVTAKLLFPFGATPSYGFDYYDEELEARIRTDDTAKFDIMVDEQVIEKTLRYTLFDRYDQFELNEDMALLYDGFVEDSFYSPDLPVTKYTYTVSDVDEESYSAANAALDVPAFDGTRKVLLMEQSGGHTQENGDIRISA